MHLLAYPAGHFVVDAMRALVLLPACLALSGCYAALNGQQTTSNGATTTTTSVATRGQVSIGSGKASASFGVPAPAGAPGGQASFSRGASAVLILGLVVAEVVNYLSAMSIDRVQSAAEPRRSIADTCSCYGYRPESGLTSISAPE